MVKHVWSVLCRKHIQDKETGSFSLFEVVEILTLTPTSEAKPVWPMKISTEMTLTSFFILESGKLPYDLPVRLVSRSPARKKLVDIPDLIAKFTTSKMLKFNLKIQELTIAGPGLYTLEVFIMGNPSSKKWSKVACVPFELRIEEYKAAKPASQDNPKP